jgi:zinc protease
MQIYAKLTFVLLLTLTFAACGTCSREDAPVLLEVPDDPTITFKVWFKVGSQNDPAGKEGLASLTGQMISDASTVNNSYEQILEKLFPMAAGYGVRVDREMTVLSGRTHKDNAGAYLDLFADAYLRPAFKQEDFDRIKSDTLNYIKNSLRFQADEELGKAALYWSIFEGSSYAHLPQGTVKGIEATTLEDVKAFYGQYYTAGNSQIALGGGFDDDLLKRFKADCGELPKGEPEQMAAIAPAAAEGLQVLLVQKPGADASISFGFPINLQRGEREFYALWLANSWLGEHRNSSSHLYQVIREARGMNYGDYSYIEAFTNGGRRSTPPTHVGRHNQIFEVWIRTLPNERSHFALRAAMRELKHLIDNGMTLEQFELTREFLRKYILHFAETTSGRLGYALDDRFYGIDGEGHLARFRAMMEEITLEEVNAAIKKHLQYENVSIAMVTGEAESLKQALAADALSPIEYDSPKPKAIMEEDAEIASFPLELQEGKIRIIPVESMFEK